MSNETNQIYKAFVGAGLEREARQHTTTEIYETKMRAGEKGIQIVPAIGRYIAILDSIIPSPENYDRRVELGAEFEPEIISFLGKQDLPKAINLLEKITSIINNKGLFSTSDMEAELNYLKEKYPLFHKEQK